MTKPNDIPQWAWDRAREAIAHQEPHESLSECVARALLEAERRGMERAAEIAETFRDDNPKPTVYAAIASDIRAAAKEIEP